MTLAGATVLAAPLAASAIGYAAVLRPRQRARAAARGAWLDDCAGLFDHPRRALAADGLPRLSGERGGVTWDIRAVPDSLAWRKLPVLWLLVSRLQAGQSGIRISAMRKPNGTEPFTPFADLPVSIGGTPALPPDVALRAEAPPQALPPADALAAPFADPRLKEVLLTPAGLRLAAVAEEADRGRYLIFRDSELATRPLAPHRLLALMAAADRLAAAIGAAATPAQAGIARP